MSCYNKSFSSNAEKHQCAAFKYKIVGEKNTADIHKHWYVFCLPLVVAFSTTFQVLTGFSTDTSLCNFIFFLSDFFFIYIFFVS